jgi:hypothetical protein
LNLQLRGGIEFNRFEYAPLLWGRMAGLGDFRRLSRIGEPLTQQLLDTQERRPAEGGRYRDEIDLIGSFIGVDAGEVLAWVGIAGRNLS